MGSLVSRAVEVVTKRVRTSTNYDNLEDVAESSLLNQPSTSDTNKGERKSGLRGKEEGKCNGDHTKQLLRSSPSKRSILNVIKLPKLKSFSRPAPREIKVAKTTTETDVVVPVIQGGDSGSDTFVIQGGDRIAALKKRLFEQQNQHMTTKRPSVPLIKSMSDGNVARKRRSLHKIFAAQGNLVPTLFPLFPRPKKTFGAGKPTLTCSLSAGACEIARYF